MDTKILQFFKLTKFLNDQQISSLDEYADFNISFNKNLNVFALTIQIKKILPIDIFEKFYYQSKQYQDTFAIQFINKTKEFNNEILNQYFKFFLKHEQINNQIQYETCKYNLIHNNSNIEIHFFTNYEKSFIEEHKELLKSWLQFYGFDFNEINPIIDVDRQASFLHIKSKQDAINEAIKQTQKSISKISKVAYSNRISNSSITPIKEIDEETINATIEGEITKIGQRISKKGYTIFSINVTDYESAIVIKAIINPQNLTNNFHRENFHNLTTFYLQEFKVGEWIRSNCKFNVDAYSNGEIIGMINKIQKIAKPNKFIRKDDAKIKRTELLVHTKMSTFDGVSEINDIFKKLKDYNMNSIGIADRNNVQAFPACYSLAKKNGVKVIYGVEFSLLNDNVTIAKNTIDLSLDEATYVVFDIETSGLYNEFDDLIEFAGLKVKNNHIIDKIDFFVKPKKPISEFIAQKTHITNDILIEKGIELNKALEKISSWVKDTVLIAHNGINFDYRFLNKKLEQSKMPLLANPIIDTMQLSKYINTVLFYHNLGAICHYFKIEYNDAIAHRADFDTEVLYEVWKILFNKLKSQGYKNLKDLQTLSSATFWSKQFNDNIIVIYCKNQESFKPLYELVSLANTKNLYGTPRVFVNHLQKIRNNFTIANNPSESIIFDNAINGTQQELEEAINFFDVIYLPSVSHFANLINNHCFNESQCQSIIKKIIKIATKLNKKIIAVSDSYYLDPNDEIARRVYINSKLLGGKAHRLYTYEGNNDILPDNHFRTTNEMISEFSFLHNPELVNQIVITNTNEFANSFPNHLTPLQSKLYPPIIKNVEQKLTSYVKEQANKIYGEHIPELIQKRIEKEMNSIINNGFSIVYWISHLLVEKSLSDGYIVGSRGSVGSSLIAYLLNITEVNPLPPHYICPKCKHLEFINNIDDGFDLPPKLCPNCHEHLKGDGHNIPFETFLGFNGEKTPDIDLNFSGEYQPKAHEFIRSMFGINHCLRAGTIASVANKTAYGYVKAYFEKVQPNNPPSSAYVDYIVNKCVNVKRTTGQHPGGIIIVPENMSVCDFTPYNYPADDKRSTWYTSHFTYDDLHDNLLKFDILGHDDPTKLKYLEELTGINPRSIPFYDPNIMNLFTKIDGLGINSNQLLGEKTGAIGIPEFGTEFVRGILVDSQPKSFADLIRISGLSHGTNVWLNNAKDLINKSHLTLNRVVACRDDIMTFLISQGLDALTSFSVMESVRKGKGINDKDLKLIKEAKIPDWYIDSCKKIAYLFPKAHATAYVCNAWRVAWFKYYYPLAFYATFFTINREVFDLETALKGKEAIQSKYLSVKNAVHTKNFTNGIKESDEDKLPVYEAMLEMIARGFGFKTISLKKSNALKFIIEDNKYLIPPFASLPSLGEVIANKIIEARKLKPFQSKEDLVKRTGISLTHLEMLNNYGVTDELQDEDQISLFEL